MVQSLVETLVIPAPKKKKKTRLNNTKREPSNVRKIVLLHVKASGEELVEIGLVPYLVHDGGVVHVALLVGRGSVAGLAVAGGVGGTVGQDLTRLPDEVLQEERRDDGADHVAEELLHVVQA